MRSKVALLLAGVAGALIGSIAVYTLRDDPFPVQLLTTSLPSGETVLNLKDYPPVSPVNEQTKKLDSTLRVQSIHDVARLESDFDQRYALYQLISNADEDELEKYIGQSTEISSRNQQMVALTTIFARYAALDPYEAIDRVLALSHVSKQNRRSLVWRIFNEWTVIDLAAAYTAIDDLPDEFKRQAANAIMWRSDRLSADQRNELARRIGPTDSRIEQVVDSNRRESLKANPRKAFYDRIHDTSWTLSRSIELDEITRYWFELEGVVVLKEIYDSLTSAAERKSVLHSLIWDINDLNNDTAASILQVVSQFPNQHEAKEATNAVFENWANFDPKASFEAALQFDDQLVSERTRSYLLRTWANVDAEGLFEEAVTMPRQFQGVAIAEAFGQISRDSPQKAIRLARNLDSPVLRATAKTAIVHAWRGYDAKSAFEWLTNNDLNVDVSRNKSLWRYTFSSYLDQDYASARTYLDQYEGEFKAQLVEATSEHLVHKDLELAIDYMKSLDCEISSSFLDQFANSLGKLGPMEALSFGETLEQHQKEAYYEDLIRSWSFQNFNSLHENIHRVPKKFHPFAANRLLDENTERSYLTDQEIKKLESMAEGVKTSVHVE